jgi:predicted nucleotidyltransferase
MIVELWVFPQLIKNNKVKESEKYFELLWTTGGGMGAGWLAVRSFNKGKLLAWPEQRANARVFGSTACGDSSPVSDVDFLVDLDPDRSLMDLGGLLTALQELLQARVDVATAGMQRPRSRERALADAIPLWGTIGRGLPICWRRFDRILSRTTRGRAVPWRGRNAAVSSGLEAIAGAGFARCWRHLAPRTIDYLQIGPCLRGALGLATVAWEAAGRGRDAGYPAPPAQNHARD